MIVLVSVGIKSVEVGCTGVLVKTVVIVGVENRLSVTKSSIGNCCQAYTAPPRRTTINIINNPTRQRRVAVPFSFRDRPVFSFIC